MKMLDTEGGFTLVELMVVVLIIGILVGIAFPVFGAARAGAAIKSCYANQRTIEGALQTYAAGHGDSYPNGKIAGALLASDPLVTEGYIKSLPLCPGNRGTYWITADQSIGGDQGADGVWYAGSEVHTSYSVAP